MRPWGRAQHACEGKALGQAQGMPASVTSRPRPLYLPCIPRFCTSCHCLHVLPATAPFLPLPARPQDTIPQYSFVMLYMGEVYDREEHEHLVSLGRGSWLGGACILECCAV